MLADASAASHWLPAGCYTLTSPSLMTTTAHPYPPPTPPPTLPPQIRALAKSKAPPSDILSACDAVRDGVFVDLGVRLEDRPDGGWGLLDY